MSNKIKKIGLIGALGLAAYLGAGSYVSHRVESQLSSPESMQRFEQTVRQGLNEGLEEKVSILPLNARSKLSDRVVSEGFSNGYFSINSVSPNMFSPKRFNPENYIVNFDYKGDTFASGRIVKTSEGYDIDRDSIVVNENSRLFQEVSGMAKGTMTTYALSILGVLGAAGIGTYLIKRKK